MTTAELRFAIGESMPGLVLVASSERGLRAVLLGDDRDALVSELRGRFPDAATRESPAELARLLHEVIRVVESPGECYDGPLDAGGTPFQREVWEALSEIEAGQTTTYGEIARRIGRPTAYRAVGSAIGANPLAVLVPCHRVIGSDGKLAGYRWGVARKRHLLELEAASRITGRAGRPEHR